MALRLSSQRLQDERNQARRTLLRPKIIVEWHAFFYPSGMADEVQHIGDSPEEIAQAIRALATPAGWRSYYGALQAAGARVVPALIEGSKHAETSVRVWCIDLLGKSGDSRGDEAVFAALKDSVADVRRHAVLAVVAMGKRGRANCAKVLAECVEKDRSLLVRRLAAHVLADLPADANVAAVLRRVMLREKDAKLRNAVWRAIGRHEEMTSPFI